MNILLAPHPDDETLFAAYTLLEHHPLVLVCYPGAARHGAPETRLGELADAMRVLGCDWLPPPDESVDLDGHLRAYGAFAEHVWAPYPEEGGHSAHNRVGELAVELWPGRVTWYTTYTEQGRSTAGALVSPKGGWQDLKVRALNCYASQIAHPGTRPHFKRGLEEYLVQPADERNEVTSYRERLKAGVHTAPKAATATMTVTGEWSTGEQLETVDVAGFVCDICDRKFTSEHGLKIHRTKAHGANGTNGDQEEMG